MEVTMKDPAEGRYHKLDNAAFDKIEMPTRGEPGTLFKRDSGHALICRCWAQSQPHFREIFN